MASMFQTPMFNQQPAQQAQPQQGAASHIHLLTNDKMPVSYQTKWADISPESQQLLLTIEERVREYREESRRLEQRERLTDSTALHKSFEYDAARILQELSAVGGAIERETAGVRENQAEASLLLLRHAEVAVRSFLSLRPRFIAAQAQLYDFYSGLPAKPSPFLQQTVIRFENQLVEYRQRIEEMERLLLVNTEKENSYGSQLSLLQSLPSVMTNVHDFFIHVAAEVEALHQHTGAMRTAFLSERHRRGDDSDPFVEAERRAVAQRDAAAKRIVHPTLHLPAPQPTTPSAPSGPASTPGLFGASQPGIFQNQSATPPASQSLFGSTPTPTSNLFGSTTPTTAGASSSSLFGSAFASTTPAGSTPAASGGLFGASTPSPLFGAQTPAASTGGLFGSQTPATSGGLFGSSTPAPTGGLFGTPTPAASGGLFGQQTPPASGGIFGQQTPPASGGIFGQQTPAASGSLFGAQSPAPTGGLFGSTTAASAPSLFNTPAPAAFGTTSKYLLDTDIEPQIYLCVCMPFI
ncbi:hypothetical protein M758_5G168700 [Ceratodon purpureus]|nr:hypothetical protein M758_5G168700 [Ceratodon purpureus]